jgi:hypothetical protein
VRPATHEHAPFLRGRPRSASRVDPFHQGYGNSAAELPATYGGTHDGRNAGGVARDGRDQKTQMAMEYTRRHLQDYGMTWWIEAGHPPQIRAALTGLTPAAEPARRKRCLGDNTSRKRGAADRSALSSAFCWSTDARAIRLFASSACIESNTEVWCATKSGRRPRQGQQAAEAPRTSPRARHRTKDAGHVKTEPGEAGGTYASMRIGHGRLGREPRCR